MNDISVFYTHLQQGLNTDFKSWALANLSSMEIDKLNRFRQKIDHDRMLLSRVLLVMGLSEMGVKDVVLKDILSYNEYHRPYVDRSRHASPDFNISHSGDVVAVALGADLLEVGLDIEKYTELDTRDYRSVFTDDEITWIGSSPQKMLRLWTRKEAVLKAHGKGFFYNPTSVNVLTSRAVLNDRTYFLHDFQLFGEYCGAVATNDGASGVKLKEIPLKVITDKFIPAA